MGNFVDIERRGRVAVLTLSRPEAMNAIGSHEDCNDIVTALRSIEDDDYINVAILTGSGRAFCAGGDLKAMKERTGIGPQGNAAETRTNYRRGVQRVVRAFMASEVPLIAAFNGHAIGLGLDLGCLCDMRVTSDRAKFAASFIKVGIVPGDGGAWSLARIIGYARAAELFFTGEPFGSDEALAMGLVSKVVPHETLMDAAFELADRIADNPSHALRMTKRLLREAQTHGMDNVLELSAAFQAIAHETPDHAEAVDSFLEKRTPQFGN